MEDQKLFTIIERYLDGSLSEQELANFEQQIAQDEDLQAEVQLQKELRKAFQDATRLHLRSSLIEIMQEPVEPQKVSLPEVSTNGIKWYFWVLLLAILSLVVGGIWYTSPSNSKIEAVPNEKETQGTDTEGLKREKTKEIFEEEESKQEPSPENNKSPFPPKSNRPIAQVEESNFSPNNVLENIISGGFRSVEELKISITAPANDPVFEIADQENINIIFRGTTEGLEKGQTASLALLVFNNRDADIPIREKSLQIKYDSSPPTIESSISLPARTGLYYWLIETEAGDFLSAGRLILK